MKPRRSSTGVSGKSRPSFVQHAAARATAHTNGQNPANGPTSAANGHGKLRAVGYCRTSGEGQRDNTSIPTQQKEIENFIKRNDWKFVEFYVDESKSGATEEGREEFKRMIRDAANERFDIIVPFDVTRFARDGVDILGNAKSLKTTFGVYVVDTKGQFDSRSSRNTMQNFLFAGNAENERLTIMERTLRGRIAKAQQGKPWAKNHPFGRHYDKATGKWSLNERGLRMRKLLERYVAGEGLAGLLKEEFTEFSSERLVLSFVRGSQLSAKPYVVEFHYPEIGIGPLRVEMPMIPEVISPKLMKRVQDRMEHRRKWNKDNRRKYQLTGFVRCAHCGIALTGNTSSSGRTYYRHCIHGSECVYGGVRSDVLADKALDYLFWMFTDEPAFNKAVTRALPDAAQRQELERDLNAAMHRLSQAQKQRDKLADAVANGASLDMLIAKQNEVLEQLNRESERVESLTGQLESMPSPEVVEKQAEQIRKQLLKQIEGRDWRDLAFDEVKAYLIFLFGENPDKYGNGIKLAKEGNNWRISFKGNVAFRHDLLDGKAVRQTQQSQAGNGDSASVTLTQQT